MLSVLFLFLVCDYALSKPDSLTIYPLRSFNKTKIREYASQARFQYDRQPAPEQLSLWQRFTQWLWQELRRSLGTAEKRTYWLYALYAFSTVMFIYWVIKLIGADKILFLYGNRSYNQQAENEVLAQEMHTTDFDMQTQVAIQRQDYRQATRLYYLKTLKLLSDRQYITWQADKTNYDYYKELPNNLPKQKFKEIIFYFEYAFYGGFSLSQAHFETVRNAFEEIQKKLK